MKKLFVFFSIIFLFVACTPQTELGTKDPETLPPAVESTEEVTEEATAPEETEADKTEAAEETEADETKATEEPSETPDGEEPTEETTAAFRPFSAEDLVFYTMEKKPHVSLQKNTQLVVVTEESTYLKYPSHEVITTSADALFTARNIGLVTSCKDFLKAYGAENTAVWETYNKEGKQTLTAYNGNILAKSDAIDSCYLYIGFQKSGSAWKAIDAPALTNILSGKPTLADNTEIVTFCVSLDEVGMINMLYVLYTTIGDLAF
ncbi:MAG: hypothetical protein II359_04525 [Clostridia bacterium]|nr:hypothetical protein [Clostridia bacterium]